MSRAAFAERFSQVFDQAPMDFVQRVRLRIAARLLTTTDLPVKIVASTIGYASRSSFSRAFEAIYGAAPTDFRSFGGQNEAKLEKIEASPINVDPTALSANIDRVESAGVLSSK